MAKTYLDSGDTFTVANNNSTVFGAAGTESVTIQAGVTGTVLDQNTESVLFNGAVSAFTFQQTGNQINVYSGATLVAKFPVQGDADGTLLTFTNGTVSAKLVAGVLQFGGTAVSSTAAAAVVPTTIDTTVVTPGGVVVPATPTFSVTGAAAVAEGASATFTVTLSAAQATATTVAYTLAGTGGAVLGTDTGVNAPAGNTGTLTFAAGATTATVVVPFTLDANTETGEGVSLTLSAPSTGTALSTTAATATTAITDVPVTYTLTASAASVFEGAAITYTLTASAASATATSVDFSVVPGDVAAADQGTSNTNLNDFAAGAFNPTTVVMAAGATTAIYVVTSATDAKTELPENYSVKAVVGTTTVATKTTSLLDGNGSGGQTFTLTTGIDQGATFVGTGGNDTFNALDIGGVAALSTLDNLDGGLGMDTLNVVQATAFATIASTTIANIETANITSGLAVNANTTTWTGLTQLNVVSSSAALETITASTTTGVSVNNNTAFGVTVVGGGLTGSVIDGAAAIIVGKAVAPVAADANAYTSFSTKGGTTVNITDNSGTTGAIGATLTSVTVDGATGAATLTGNAIANLTLKNGVATTAVTVTNAAVAAQTLNVTLDTNAVGAAVVDATAKTVTVTATGAKASTIDLAIVGATALTTSGAAALTLATVAENYTALKTLTVNNTGAFNADLSAANTASAAALTSIVATASTGANTLAIDATKTTYAGGSGVDAITIAAAPTKAISGGAGTADVLVVNTAAGFNASANTNISGFETLGLGILAGAAAYDATGFANVTTGNTTGASSFTNVAPGTAITFTAANANVIGYSLANSTGLVDAVTVNQALAASGANLLTATGVETVNINATNTTVGTPGAVAIMNTLTLSAAPSGSATTTINVTSGALTGVTLIDTTDLTISTVNASGVQGDGVGTAGTGFAWTSGILAATTLATTTTVTGSMNGGDTINLAAAVDLVVINGASKGVNALTGSLANKSTITGGTGADTIVGGNLADTIVGGGGADVITGGAGADKITISGATSKLINFATGDSGANTSTTIQTAELTSTFDVVTGVTAGTTYQLATATPALTATNSANLAGADNLVVFARGTYDSGAGTFTYSASGADTAMTYDTNTVAATTAFETVVLVGFVQGATTAIAGNLITFA